MAASKTFLDVSFSRSGQRGESYLRLTRGTGPTPFVKRLTHLLRRNAIEIPLTAKNEGVADDRGGRVENIVQPISSQYLEARSSRENHGFAVAGDGIDSFSGRDRRSTI